jgi:hypothetical protein
LRGQNNEPKYDSRGDIDQSDEKGRECAQVYKYIEVLRADRHWEDNESFFVALKKEMIEGGCVEPLLELEQLESYIRWKGKEDSAKYGGKSMLRMRDC